MRQVDRPQPGFYRLRLVRNGPWRPARISYGPARDPLTGERLDRSPLWSAEIAGKLVAPPSPDPYRAGVYRVWHWGRPISLAEYTQLMATTPRDLSVLPPLF